MLEDEREGAAIRIRSCYSSSYSSTSPGAAVMGFCRCNQSPKSVNFELIKKENILGVPDIIR